MLGRNRLSEGLMKGAGPPVVVDLEGDSEEVEEQNKYDALIAFDEFRGCICYGDLPKTKSVLCPIHCMVRPPNYRHQQPLAHKVTENCHIDRI